MCDQLGRLRPATDADLPVLLEWRNHPAIQSMMYTQHRISPSEHRIWWNRVKAEETHQVYLYERHGAAVGVVSFSDIQKSAGTAFWAFYAAPNAVRGTGSLMEYAALEHFFSKPGMRKLNCEVLGRNNKVIALHFKFGFSEEGIFVAHKRIGDDFDNVHRLAIFREKWNDLRDSVRETLIEREKQ